MGQAGVMPQLPTPFRPPSVWSPTALDEAQNLPDKAIELPMLAVSTALQLSLRAQQRYAHLAARGDALLNRRERRPTNRRPGRPSTSPVALRPADRPRPTRRPAAFVAQGRTTGTGLDATSKTGPPHRAPATPSPFDAVGDDVRPRLSRWPGWRPRPSQPIPVRVVAQKIGEWIARLGEIWVDGQIAQLTRRPGAATQFLTLRDPDANISLTVTCARGVLRRRRRRGLAGRAARPSRTSSSSAAR